MTILFEATGSADEGIESYPDPFSGDPRELHILAIHRVSCVKKSFDFFI